MEQSLKTWENWYEENKEQILLDFFKFLSFKSIGTDHSFDQETRECADWLFSYLSEMGLDVTLWETSGKPVVFAQDLRAGKDLPTLLLYHHYDVQPVDPLELWDSDPFVPTVKEGSVFARGAQDNKGQCFYTLSALKALYQLTDALPFNLKVFIEGEEESGSVGTKQAIVEHAEDLKADAMLAIDSNMAAPGIGAITLGIRGMVTGEVVVRCAGSDMHSGMLGGAAYNPIRALTHALSACYDATGKVAIPHFYDSVKELTSEEKSELDLEIDQEVVKQEFSILAFSPEPGYTIGESVGIRPTFEINGILGGYTGEGFKTVLPAKASAKISCRLVPDQDPEEIFQNLEVHLRKHLPEGMEMELHHDQGARAFRTSGNSKIAKLAAKAYEEVLGVPCKKILCGGSIPIVTDLAKVIGGDVLMMGFGLDRDQIHAPNEHFGLDRFKQGFLTLGRIFSTFDE